MTIWLDAQLSPRTAHWIAANLAVSAVPLRDLGLRDSDDEEIFAAARAANAIVLTKDGDFVRLLEQHGSPPKIIWLTCGNTSDAALQQILARHSFDRVGVTRQRRGSCGDRLPVASKRIP